MGGPLIPTQHGRTDGVEFEGGKTGHTAKRQNHRMVENSNNSKCRMKVHGAAHAPRLGTKVEGANTDRDLGCMVPCSADRGPRRRMRAPVEWQVGGEGLGSGCGLSW